MTNLEESRAQVADAADHRCCIWHPTHGRCAGLNCHAHHIKYRSHGGGDEAENLSWICAQHHDDIHDGRLKVGHVGEFTTYTSVDGTELYLWPQIAEDEMSTAILGDVTLRTIKREMEQGAWAFAFRASEMLTARRYELLGYESEGEYAASLDISRDYLLKAVLAYRRTEDMGQLGVRLRALPSRLTAEASEAWVKLAGEQPDVADEIVAAVEVGGLTASAAILSVREAVATDPTEARVEITGTVTGTWVFKVSLRDGIDPEQEVLKRLAGSAPRWLKDEDGRVMAEFKVLTREAL